MSNHVESPIEDDLLDAMIRACDGRPIVILHRVSLSEFDREVKADARCRIHIATQVRCGSYRADFIVGYGARRVCVEADGQDFHSSAAQVYRDQKRDEWFISHGISVIRLSGKQIVRDPYKCARRVLEDVTGSSFREDGPRQVGDHLEAVIALCASKFEATP